MVSVSWSALSRETRENLRLALPLIAAQLSFVSMGTVDTIFAGRLGASELAAVAVGSNVWFLVFIPFLGLSMAVSPIVAQRVGRREATDLTGRFLRGTLGLALLLGVLWFAVMQAITPPALYLLELDARTHHFAAQFLHAIAWAGPPYSLCFFLRNGAEGHALTRIPLYAGLAGLSTNILFNWLLMWGHGGFPQLGPRGCALATVIAGWVMVLVYVIAYAATPTLRALRLLRRDAPVFAESAREVLSVGLPIAAILAAECWLFSAGALLMARFGAATVAAHQIAINFAALSFMVPTAIGMATAVRVGHAAGAGDAEAVALRGRAGIALGAGYSLLSASVMALAPAAIVALYTDVTDLAQIAIHFVGYAALFQVFDCIQATANGALRGLKDTRVPMLITVLAYWAIGMPLAVGLAFQTATGPTGIWWGFIVGLGVAAGGLSWRFARLTRMDEWPQAGVSTNSE